MNWSRLTEMATKHATALQGLAKFIPTGVSLPAAIFISVALHTTTLSLNFVLPDTNRAVKDKALEIILVNSKAARRPSDAQALAQTNLDGGGNVDENRRAKTPLPPSARQQAGADLEQKQQRVQALEAQQQKLMAQTRSKRTTSPQELREAQPEPSPTLSGREMASSALAMARLEAEISKNVEEYNKRPRKKNIGVRADEYRFAQYVEDWRLKVERIGTLNYPDAAKGKLYGSLVLSVNILSDGTVQKIEINRSSGHKILDDAARRIVQMASPYAAFPPDIRRDTDIIEITRTWAFTRNDALETR
jgi:protein TonB